MSEHVGYIIRITELRPHSNADRLQIATIFGQSVIVGLDTKIGDIGVYFPVDLQLSEEYCRENDLVRRRDEAGNPAGGYLDPSKRNIRAMKLRGEKSEGLYMPLSSLDYIFERLKAEDMMVVGDRVDTLDGHEVCRKYIPRGQKRATNPKSGNKTRKHTVPIAPLFKEHVDTEQLVYNLGDFRPGDQVEITLKLHGTSQRTGYLPKFKGYKRTLKDRILRRPGTPIYEWDYVTGTRRVVLNDFESAGGYYGDNNFRAPAAQAFEGKLWASESVYYEVVGFTDHGKPIMPTVSNKKVDWALGTKNFSKRFGSMTEFSYGCDLNGITGPRTDFYVYRMTATTKEGNVIEYSPDFMRYRCEQIGVKCVPILWRGFIPENIENAGKFIQDIAEQYYDGPDPIGRTHIREGVVCRIVNRPSFCAYKHKNFSFKVLSGIVAENIIPQDMDADILSEI